MAGVCQPSEYLTQILPTYPYIPSSQVWALQELETNWLQIPLMLKRKENLIPYLPSKAQEEKHTKGTKFWPQLYVKKETANKKPSSGYAFFILGFQMEDICSQCWYSVQATFKDLRKRRGQGVAHVINLVFIEGKTSASNIVFLANSNAFS